MHGLGKESMLMFHILGLLWRYDVLLWAPLNKIQPLSESMAGNVKVQPCYENDIPHQSRGLACYFLSCGPTFTLLPPSGC